MVRYLADVHPGTKFKKKAVTRRGILQLTPGQGNDGYGRKISTDYMARVNDRWQRVYCVCISNVGSLYVLQGTEKLFVRDSDIPDDVR